MSTASTLNSTTLPLSDSTHDRVTWRLMPLLLVCYVFAHLDRINIGFAKLQMSADLHFSDTVYGLGAGLFFIAYALFGLPSNLMLERIGPRRWIACLMLVWGCLSTAMLLVETARGFYLLRFLLGVAEAGFFPGILVYLNRWFPARRRGQITALFAIAVPMAGVIGGPLSGWILEGFHDALGLRGWQWMFLIEGLPVVLLGVVVWCSLPESFERVTWLSDEQKHLLREELAGEEQRKTITSFSGIFSNPQVWLLVAIYFAVMLAVNTIAFWMPSLIHGAGIAQDSRIGMLSAVPYLAGCAFMIFIGRSSDRLRERRWHLGIPLLMAATGLSLAALAPTSAWLVMGGLVIAGMGASAALPMFWQLPPAFLSSATLAAGIALISSFGSIAAFLAPYLIGWMRDTTQSASLALYLLAILIALGAGLVLRTPPPWSTHAEPRDPDHARSPSDPGSRQPPRRRRTLAPAGKAVLPRLPGHRHRGRLRHPARLGRAQDRRRARAQGPQDRPDLARHAGLVEHQRAGLRRLARRHVLRGGQRHPLPALHRAAGRGGAGVHPRQAAEGTGLHPVRRARGHRVGDPGAGDHRCAHPAGRPANESHAQGLRHHLRQRRQRRRGDGRPGRTARRYRPAAGTGNPLPQWRDRGVWRLRRGAQPPGQGRRLAGQQAGALRRLPGGRPGDPRRLLHPPGGGRAGDTFHVDYDLLGSISCRFV